MEYISRKIAFSTGLRHYFTGIPCSRGHIAKRNYITRQCSECSVEYQRKHRKDPLVRKKNCEQSMEHYRRDPWINWPEEKKTKRLNQIKTWKSKNPKSVKKARDRYFSTTLNARLAHNLRKRLRLAIKNNERNGSAVKQLGCKIETLKTHLEKLFSSEMMWDNWGKVWQIDHIIPLCAFDLTDKVQLAKACHFTNLQPLLIQDHNTKSVNDRSIYSRPKP